MNQCASSGARERAKPARVVIDDRAEWPVTSLADLPMSQSAALCVIFSVSLLLAFVQAHSLETFRAAVANNNADIVREWLSQDVDGANSPRLSSSLPEAMHSAAKAASMRVLRVSCRCCVARANATIGKKQAHICTR